MSWRYSRWSADHPLPIGASERAVEGQEVRAGDVLAAGTTYGTPVRVAGARRIGIAPDDLARVMRVPVGGGVERKTVIARTGRRFARAVTAPFDGRLVQVRTDGDLDFAPIVGRWIVRAALDGIVGRSSDAEVVTLGTAWCLQGLAAYGPDAVGELALVADGPADEIAPSRIDVGQRDRILIGGGRGGAESIARAHACGAAAVVTGAVPASGLRAVFGDDVGAHGAPLRADAPTVLCLAAFGTSSLPAALYSPFAMFAGVRASVHTASARLFVFADAGAAAVPATPPSLALASDWGGVRALDGQVALAEDTRFASEVVAAAVATDGGALPAANVLPFDAAR